jgi:hypothetical protein
VFNHLNVCDNLNFFISTVNELLNVMAEILSQIKEISKRISRLEVKIQFIFQFNSFLHKQVKIRQSIDALSKNLSLAKR